jgi:hypothetical protein
VGRGDGRDAVSVLPHPAAEWTGQPSRFGGHQRGVEHVATGTQETQEHRKRGLTSAGLVGTDDVLGHPSAPPEFGLCQASTPARLAQHTRCVCEIDHLIKMADRRYRVLYPTPPHYRRLVVLGARQEAQESLGSSGRGSTTTSPTRQRTARLGDGGHGGPRGRGHG